LQALISPLRHKLIRLFNVLPFKPAIFFIIVAEINWAMEDPFVLDWLLSVDANGSANEVDGNY